MSESHDRGDGLTRKELLQSGAGAAAGVLLAQSGLGRALAATEAKGNPIAGMNVILVLTDQERAIQHFPPRWMQRNLPGMMQLRRHGISFERAFTNACMCSPARSTLMSGYFPAQHGVKYTLEEDMPAYQGYPQVELPLPRVLPNLATVMDAAGYNVVYKGKWHCSKPPSEQGRQPGRPRGIWLQPLESSGRRREPDHSRGRRRVHEQRRPLHGLDRQPGGRGRGNSPVPLDGRRQATTLLHGPLAGQPARRPLLSGHDLRAVRLRQLLDQGRHPDPGDQRRGPLDEADRAEAVPEDLQPDRQAEERQAEARLPELLRQPDALLGLLPHPGARTSSSRPASTTTR